MKAVIFDFDGTIADSFPFFISLIQESSKKLGLKDISQDDLEKMFKDNSLKDLVQHFRMPLLKLFFHVYRFQYKMGQDIDKIKPYPQISNLLMQLKKQNILTGILTGNSKSNVRKFLQKEGLTNCIDFVVSNRLSFSFNKEKSLRRVMSKYHLNPKEVFYLTDELNDLFACRKVGVNCILVSWGYDSKKILLSEANLVVDTVPDLADQLGNLLKIPLGI